ncbi:MAG: SDR family oxidoreductase [Herpetosiphonaceae bacterium]|nr:SDR family oxidoreductase [Herpetosiphonaceae bacterium]
MPKTVVITGAGRGIGRATARAFAAEGATVVVASRTAAELQSLVAEIAAAGGRAVAVPCDISAEPDVVRLMEQASALHGRIDVLVCAAGVAAIAPFEQLALADWERTLQVGLTGMFLGCKHASPHMGAGGLIVALGSIAGRAGFPHWSAYSAAKFGLIGFTQAIREELRPRGIRVTTIIAAAVDTPLWDAVPGEWNRANMLQPAEVAQTILHVASTPPHIQMDEVMVGHVVGKL